MLAYENKKYPMLLMQAIEYNVLLGLPMMMLLHNDGDRQLMAELYMKHRDLMHKVASLYFSADSRQTEDAVSETVVRLCKNFSTVKTLDCHKISAYIVKVSRSACIDLLRRGSRAAMQAGGDTLEAVPDKDADLDVAMSRTYALDLLAAFPQLSDRDKELIRMRHIDGMSYEDIAKALHLTEQTARAAVSRARRKLQLAARHMDLEEFL